MNTFEKISLTTVWKTKKQMKKLDRARVEGRVSRLLGSISER